MRKLIILFAITLAPLAYSQPIQVKKVKKKSIVDGMTVKEKYFVLESDNSIKHGEYKRYDILNDLMESGFYNMGIKDSTWKTYIIGKYVGSIGNYKNGKKNGEWNYYWNVGTRDPLYDPKSPVILIKSGFYNEDKIDGIWNYYKKGKLEQRYDHSNDSLIFPLSIDDKYIYTIKNEGEVIKSKLDRPPLLVGGYTVSMEKRKNIDDSKLYKLSNGQENVSYALSFWVKPTGETYGYEMVKSVNTEYDNYIIEYYKENYKWVPGLLNGENIEVKITVSAGYIVKI